MPTSGCGLVSFDVTEKVDSQTIPGSSTAAASPSTLFETTISVSSESLPRGSGLVDSVTLSRVTFNVRTPDKGNFDFAESATLTITAPDNPNLSPVKIAEGTPTAGASTLTLQPTGDVNLLPYVRSGAVIRASAVGRQPTTNVTFDGEVILTVHF